MHIAYATAPGSSHVNPGNAGKINNQDAISVRIMKNGFVAVLCDGCGSQPHSEVGADFGSNTLARLVADHLSRSTPQELDWPQITVEISKKITLAAAAYAGQKYGPEFERAVTERFLFTALVCAVQDDIGVIASFGDGVVIADDEKLVIPSPMTNTPVYLGYLLFPNNDYQKNDMQKHLAFTVVKSLVMSRLEKGLVLGTDGLKALLNEELQHPALAQPDGLKRWLNVRTAERIHNGTFLNGKCRDDVTILVVRTDEAQVRLLAERSEVVELKKKIDALKTELAERGAALTRAQGKVDELLREIGIMRFELMKLRPPVVTKGISPILVPGSTSFGDKMLNLLGLGKSSSLDVASADKTPADNKHVDDWSDDEHTDA